MDTWDTEYLEFSREYMWNEEFEPALCSILKIKDGICAADIGSGMGALLLFLSEYTKDSHLYGVDTDCSLLNRGSESMKAYPSTNTVDFVGGDGENLPFKDNTFDLVTAQTLLCNVKDPLSVIKEMRRITKKGGTVCAIEPDSALDLNFIPDSDGSDDDRWDFLRWKAQWAYCRGVRKVYKRDIAIGFRVPSLFRLAGFAEIRVRGYLGILHGGDFLFNRYELLELFRTLNKGESYSEEEMEEIYRAGGLTTKEYEQVKKLQQRDGEKILEILDTIRLNDFVSYHKLVITTGEKD
jgi:SAM-dependent methyltransferase